MRDASCWEREYEWHQDIAVVTKWLSGVSPVCLLLLFCGHSVLNIIGNYTSRKDCLSFFVFTCLFLIKKLLISNMAFVLESCYFD